MFDGCAINQRHPFIEETFALVITEIVTRIPILPGQYGRGVRFWTLRFLGWFNYSHGQFVFVCSLSNHPLAKWSIQRTSESNPFL